MHSVKLCWLSKGSSMPGTEQRCCKKHTASWDWQTYKRTYKTRHWCRCSINGPANSPLMPLETLIYFRPTCRTKPFQKYCVQVNRGNEDWITLIYHLLVKFCIVWNDKVCRLTLPERCDYFKAFWTNIKQPAPRNLVNWGGSVEASISGAITIRLSECLQKHRSWTNP